MNICINKIIIYLILLYIYSMLEKVKNIINKFVQPADIATGKSDVIVKYMQNADFSFMWTNASSLLNNKVRIDLNTMYNISKTNKMAWAYIEKISNMVWRYWFEIFDQEGNKVDTTKDKKAKEMLDNCKRLFRSGYGDNKTFDIFSILYFTQVFSSGEVTITASELNPMFKTSKNWRVKILDTRWIEKDIDDYGEIKKFNYKTWNKREPFLPEQVVNYIAYPDIDNPVHWLSKFNRIYMEAISNFEANSRQMYFFRNNAMPNIMVMLDADKMSWNELDIKKKLDDFKDTRDKKYMGQSNQGKPLITSVVKDIKILDTNNVDLDLINLRKENDKDFAVIFLMDTRLIGINKEAWSYGEVESTTIRQGNDQIDAYGEMMSETLNLIYKKFVDPEVEYIVKTKNAEFTNDIQERNAWIIEVREWLLTPNDYIKNYGSWVPSDDPEMDKYRTPQNSPQQPVKA